VIGILGSATAESNAPVVSAFMQGLKDIGSVEGQNMAIGSVRFPGADEICST
jgi:hypothetical protein